MSQETQDDEALAFVNSVRGQYILSQALHLAIRSLQEAEIDKQECSNIQDMEYMLETLFPMYSALHQFKETIDHEEPHLRLVEEEKLEE